MISRLVMHIPNHYYISTEGNFVIRQLARGSIRTPMCLLVFCDHRDSSAENLLCSVLITHAAQAADFKEI